MFYDIFSELCASKGISCTRATKEIGLSNATATKWKNTGATPDGSTLARVASYFDVSIDYLLGNEKTAAQKDDGLDKLTDTQAALVQIAKRLTETEAAALLAAAKSLEAGRTDQDAE